MKKVFKSLLVLTLVVFAVFSTAVLASAVDTNSSKFNSAINAYITFLKNNSGEEDTTGYCADINGDNIPELIFEAWTSSKVVVFSYDSDSNSVVQLFTSNMGKGYAMDVYVDAAAGNVIVPSGSTGGMIHNIYNFSGNKYTLLRTFEYKNGKHSDSGLAEYYLNGKLINVSDYNSLLANAKAGYVDVDYTVSELLVVLNNLVDTPLGKTSKITATQNTSAIKLTWNKVSGADGYRIFYKSGSTWKKYKDVTANTITISNLNSGTKFTFAVMAGKIVDGKVIWSKEYTTINTATKAVKPSKVVAEQNTSTIRLTWSTCKGATGYRIYYKSGSSWKVCVSTTSSTTHTFAKLNAGSKYTFAVRPYILINGTVLWSDYTQFTTATKPATVTAKASSASTGKITLTWNKVNGADGYQVYYKIGNGSYKLYKTYGDVKTLTFSGLKSGTKYTFAVRAGIRTSGGNIFGGYNPASIVLVASQAPTLNDSQARNLWQRANNIYYMWGSWGVFDNIDKSRGIYFDDSVFMYYPVVHPSINTKAQLMEYLLNYFDESISNDVVNRFREYNKKLYVCYPTGRGISPEFESAKIKSQNGNNVEIYLVFVNNYGQVTTYVQKMRYTNNNWIFVENFYCV